MLKSITYSFSIKIDHQLVENRLQFSLDLGLNFRSTLFTYYFKNPAIISANLTLRLKRNKIVNKLN